MAIELKKSANCIPAEGVYISSVDYVLDSDTVRSISRAEKAMEDNPEITSVQIDGSKIWNTVEQFFPDLDSRDDELTSKTPVDRDDLDYFRSDVQRLEIDRGGNIALKAWGKWTGTMDLWFYIE